VRRREAFGGTQENKGNLASKHTRTTKGGEWCYSRKKEEVEVEVEVDHKEIEKKIQDETIEETR
jgi:hypothetical protein